MSRFHSKNAPLLNPNIIIGVINRENFALVFKRAGIVLKRIGKVFKHVTKAFKWV